MAYNYANPLSELPGTLTGPEMLDQTRKRLHALSASLEQLVNKLRAFDALPTWESLQTTNDELSGHLGRIRGLLTDPHISAYLRAAHPYPLQSFPGAQQQAMLAALTRKRFEIPVQDWTVSMKSKGHVIDSTDSESGQLDQTSLTDLWDWVPLATGDVFRKAVRGGGAHGEDEEIEENEDEDADGGEPMEDIQQESKNSSEQPGESAAEPTPMMELTRVLPFVLTGNLPPLIPPPPVKR